MKKYLLPELKASLKLILGLFLTSILFFFVDLEELYTHLRTLDRRGVIAILIVSLLLVLFQALRLHLLIRQYASSYFDTFKLTMVGQFFSNFLPGSVSGDVYKIYFLKKQHASLPSAVTLIALDRLIALVLVLFFGGIYFIWLAPNELALTIHTPKALNVLIAIAALSLMAIVLYKSSKRVQSKLERLARDLKKEFIQFDMLEVLLFLLVAISTYFIRLLKLQILIIAFGQTMKITDLVLLVFIVQLAGMIPMSIGGLGLIEASLVFGLSLFAIPPDTSLAMAIVNRFIVWLFSLIGGFWWLTTKKHHIEEKT